jgi:hypothetical protein
VTVYRVYIETGPAGLTVAHCLEPLGAFARGRTREEALSAARAAVTRRLEWLEELGEDAGEKPGPNEIVVAEDIAVNAGAGGALFAPERAPAERADIEAAIRLLALQRWEILRLLRSEREPHPSPLPPRKGGDAALVRLLGHLAAAERRAFARIKPLPRAPRGAVGTLARAGAVRTALYEGLRGLTPAESAAVWETDAGAWTVRRLLRTLVEHEWGHIKEAAGGAGPNKIGRENKEGPESPAPRAYRRDGD